MLNRDLCAHGGQHIGQGTRQKVSASAVNHNGGEYMCKKVNFMYELGMKALDAKDLNL